MTPTEIDTEKRQFHRMPETVSITVKKLVYPLTDDDAIQGVGKNISAGGVCFAVPHAYEPGDLLSLQVNLAGWQRHKHSYAAVIDDDVAMAPLTAVVKVAWCRSQADTRGYEIGVTFENVYADDFKALKKYLTPQ
ncbi:MAG: PilZ domain-containing protein [Desulfobacteraceae bacterium]|nr:PilZ domain-containing protein [Desulfobacteraceae bacterium]MBC2750361.1 PilZ domain-containing protein [Desulfobacteraceae bacterium]